MKLIFFGCIVLFLISPLVRCVTTHLHLVGIYSVVDLIIYFVERRWRNFNLYGIDIFIFYRNVRSRKDFINDPPGQAYI